MPAHIVQIKDAAVRVQVEHLVDHGLQQRRVVTDHDKAAAMCAEVVTQPRDGIGVEVVRRLVEQERLRTTEQDAGKLHRGVAGHRTCS